VNFSLICLIGIIVTLPFGLAFAFIPEPASAPYGVAGWNPGTASVARLFGVELLYVSAALFAVRPTTDPMLQRRFAMGFCLVSALAVVLALQSVLSGATGQLSWSTVAIYGFFVVVWALFTLRSPK
jgi:hypothetical protein